ncbi:MAG: hypothetical protein U0570_08165 [Phycisphaerales bacterium]
MSSFSWHSAAFFFSITCAGVPLRSEAANADEATIRRWIESQLAQPQAVSRVQWLKLSYIARDFPQLSEAQYEALKQSAKTSTDPMDQIRLQRDEIPQRLGFDSFEHTVWWHKSGSWRFNTTYPNRPKSAFHDVALSDIAAWQLSPKQLTVLDPSRPPPANYNLASVESQINSDVSQLIDAWLNNGLAGAPRLTRVSVTEDKWTAELTGDIVSQEVHGRWDVQAQRPFVERTVFTRTPHRDGPGLTIEYSDWKKLEGNAGDWIAQHLVQLKPDGRKSRTIDVASVGPLEEKEFQSVVQAPPPTGADPIRGKLTATTVYDFARGTASKIDTKTSKQVQTEVLPRLQDEESSWQRVGWVVLASAVAVLVGVRYFRKSSK